MKNDYTGVATTEEPIDSDNERRQLLCRKERRHPAEDNTEFIVPQCKTLNYANMVEHPNNPKLTQLSFARI